MPEILTPDQRVRVFVSSTLEELAPERVAATRAIEALHLTPVLFELGARPHPPQELYRAYLEQSHVFVGIYWQRYGWVAPHMDISGLEDELVLAGDRPKLVYLKRPAPDREPRLQVLLDRVRDSGVSYRAFETPAELEALIAEDLSMLLSERFQLRGAPSASALRPTPLPVATTSFVGRYPELDDVVARLAGDARLVTLVGPGGIGKTRLALEIATRVAAERPDQVVAFVPLESVRDPSLIGSAILRALDVGERGSEASMDVVREHLAERRVLLVIDNLEHLLDGAGALADLLAATRHLQILATSREPLRVRAEHEVLVPPLAETDAVDLFLDRARLARSDLHPEDLDAIRAICEALDGVPLAVELAAARTRLLSPRDIRERLNRRLDFLVAGPRDLPARQQALRSTIAWSHDLLDAAQQQAFAALGAFAGSFTERAAADVVGHHDVLDVLASLVDKSLLVVEPPGEELRVRMLGMVREFAVEQLRAGHELERCRQRHAEHYHRIALEAAAPLRTAAQPRWLDRLETDMPNLRAALEWWIGRARYDELAEMAWYLWLFSWLRSYQREVSDLLRPVLTAPDVGERAHIRLQAVVGILEAHCGGSEAIPRMREAADRARAEGMEDVLAPTLMQLAVFAGERDMDEALGLFRKLGDQWGVAAVLCAKAWVLVHLEAMDGADAVFDEALEAALRIGDELVIAMVLANTAERATHQGDHDTAARMVADSVARYRRLRAGYPASYAVEAAAHLAAQRGRAADAVRLVAAAEGLRASIDVPIWAQAAQRHERLIERLREVLDPAAFGEAWRSVEGLDYQGTLDLVLETLDLVPESPEGSP